MQKQHGTRLKNEHLFFKKHKPSTKHQPFCGSPAGLYGNQRYAFDIWDARQGTVVGVQVTCANFEKKNTLLAN